MKKALIFILLSVATLWSAESKKYVQPKENDVGIYKNEIRALSETPIFKVGLDDRLLVIDANGDKYKVQSVEGQTGWVEKKFVVQIGKSKTFIFDNAEITGYLDNPTPVYILDADDPNSERVYLNRSFKDNLRDNVDKETIERQVHK
jgi:hypothetical protein